MALNCRNQILRDCLRVIADSYGPPARPRISDQPSGLADTQESKREAKTMPCLGTEFRNDVGSNPGAATATISPPFWD